MFDRIANPLRLPLAGLACLVGCWLGMPAGTAAPAPLQAAQFDPSDVYFQGYLAVREAERLEASGDFIGAMEKLNSATKAFEAVHKYYPAWKSSMVDGRSAKTAESIERVRPQAEAQINKNRNTVAELEGGIKASGKPVNPADKLDPGAGNLQVDPLATRHLADAEAEVKRLRDLAARQPKDPSASGSRLQEVERERDLLQAQLRAAETNVESLRARLAAAPMEKDLKTLNQRIETLNQEREAMAMALTQSRSAHTEALAKIATLEADLKVMQQQHADLERDLKTERHTSNKVVDGQRLQLEALKKQLNQKDAELAKANTRISGLMKELKESQDAFTQLHDERDSLLKERDELSALFKLNEASRIQELIEQNVKLAKNLREANEKVDRLNRENNADQDATTAALTDLAIAKSQINRLHQEKRDQDQRIAELENRLKDEEQALANGHASTDPAEAEVLRDIIKRQLHVQERRRQARDLLVEAAKEMGSQNEHYSKAVELLDTEEITLTPAEQKLVENTQVDGEFISPVSPYARDRASVGRATDQLNRDIAVFERTAEKSFVAGRLLPTRELYQMILEQHPNHTPSLCRLGVVDLRLNDVPAAVDTFRRAVEMDPNNPYAYRMLGLSLMQLNDMPGAEQAVRHSVDLAPNDAKSQMLLGTICYRLNRTSEAESYFKAAITADPTLSEPYYDLALICSRGKRMEDARNYYQQALERGSVPDPALEAKLDKQ